jgi:hypothetical protein
MCWVLVSDERQILEAYIAMANVVANLLHNYVKSVSMTITLHSQACNVMGALSKLEGNSVLVNNFVFYVFETCFRL